MSDSDESKTEKSAFQDVSVSATVTIDPLSRRPTQASVLPPLGQHAQRFRQAVQKVMRAHRTAVLMERHGAGGEPGVDVRQAGAHDLYGHIKRPCTIDVIDYTSVRATFKSYSNAEFLQAQPLERESWVKVRWIHVNGISWDILSQLALTYEMHPLALEDVLQSRVTSPSKSSYYLKHLFLRVVCHTISEFSPTETVHSGPDSSNADGRDSDGSTFLGASQGAEHDQMSAALSAPAMERPMPQRWISLEVKEDQQRAQSTELRAIKDDLEHDRVHVDLSNLFIFLFRDGTVITFHTRPHFISPDNSIFNPIFDRIRSSKSILRSSADASLLVESLLDLIVDEALDIVDEYRDLLIKLESRVLVAPTTHLVRALHIISGDLALRKHSLEPIMSLVRGLRRYDLERSLALSTGDVQKGKTKEPNGFMSSKAKIYMTDVYDHIRYVLSSIDQFSTQSENLISYIFNLSSNMISTTMSRLTLVTVIFMPPILLAGYFGMNFTRMWSVHNNNDSLYWKIAIPMLAVILPAFLWADMQRVVHRIRKEYQARQAERVVARRSPSIIDRRKGYNRI